MYLTRERYLRTLFLRLYSENGPHFLCPVIIRVTYRSTEQLTGQTSTVEPLFKDTHLIQILFPLVTIDPSPFTGGVLDISLGGEVRRGPSYPDPVSDKYR